MDKDEKMKYGMPDFSYDVDVISDFIRCGALQMFTAYKGNYKMYVSLCLHISDIIKLM